MTTILPELNARTVSILIVATLALAAFTAGLGMVLRSWRQRRISDHVDRRLENRDTQRRATGITSQTGTSALSSMLERAAEVGMRWGDGRFGDVLLADEDRKLLDLCGYGNYGRARALFLFVRGVLAVGLPLLVIVVFNPDPLLNNAVLSYLIYGFFGFGLGWMLPKWVVARRYRARKIAVTDELPLLVDLLRLLQGVGLSMDQSLHVIENEFKEVLPVLGQELLISVEQYARGRTRMQSMARMINGFDNEDLEMICRLIAQVDEHGGAIQDPLLRFSERLREQRRMGLKERVGKLTVKMTGVMVLTLLPALLVITAGSGFIAVFRGLSQMAGN